MKKIVYILSVAVAMNFASCQNSEEQTPTVGGSAEVVFTSAISTRVTGTQWDNDDEIGVFMYETDLTEVLGDNALYTTSGEESGTFTSLNPLIYPEYSNVDFIAYYPYTAEYSSNIITLNTVNQSSAEMLKAQDFMVASAQRCDESNTPALSFTRKMSRILINVIRKDTKADAVLSDIKLCDVTTDGTFTIINSPVYRDGALVSAGDTTSDISLFFDESSSTIEAIIIPQTVSLSKLMLFIDGQLFEANILGTFAENTQYNYTFSVGCDAVDFTEGTISDWDETESGEMETTFGVSPI